VARLDGKIAIITGATSGIGTSTTRLFIREGAQVVLVGRRHEAGKRLADELGDGARFKPVDLTGETAAEDVIEFTMSLGPPDILVNNAGIDFASPLLESTVLNVREVFEVNVFAALWMMQAAARSMRGRGGSIVNVTSRTAQVGVSTMGVYGAAKAALAALTRAAAIEWACEGIRVNSVAPGLTMTPLVEAWLAKQTDPHLFQAEVEATIPQRRFAKPEEVASAILFLASDEAAHITGASLAVDGGYTAA
jgi:NAD(P)-dependent dehydrogenase (short-subunit alcohol dehydrogenase family)